MSKFVAFLNDETGASAAEYVLILALVGIAIVVGAGAVATALNGQMTTATAAIPAA